LYIESNLKINAYFLLNNRKTIFFFDNIAAILKQLKQLLKMNNLLQNKFQIFQHIRFDFTNLIPLA